MTEKYVYNFAEGNKDMRDLLGGKGANLAEMSNLKLPVPPGFTITTEACNRFYVENEKLWNGLLEEVKSHIDDVENILNKKFSDTENPLLFSIAVSSPNLSKSFHTSFPSSLFWPFVYWVST